jgi:DNA-binding Xre family transcriptional regulator
MGILFGHFAFETDPTSKALLRCNLSKRVHSFLSDIDSCSMKLFNGETVYPSSQRQIMTDMLSIRDINGSAKSTTTLDSSIVTGSPVNFIVARQKTKDLELSDLQEICNELICEREQID